MTTATLLAPDTLADRPASLRPLPAPLPADQGFHTTPWALARTVGGLAALGLAAGVAGQSETLASAPAGLTTGAGVILLTAPALVVAHQSLGMQASPGVLLAALADGLARTGAIALGAAPAVLWLGASSDLGPAVGLATLIGAGVFGLIRTMNGLVEAERAAGGSVVRVSGLALAWITLAALVALRLLIAFVF